MSDQAPVPAEELKTATVEEPTKTEEIKTKEEAPKLEQPDIVKQQTARAIKAEEELKELKKSLLEKEQASEKAEEEKKRLELEKKWQFDELITTITSEREAEKAEIEKWKAAAAELETIRTAEKEAAMKVIPEDKQHLAENMDIKSLKDFASIFAVGTSFWWTPDVKKSKPWTELQKLEAELAENGFLSGTKQGRLEQLRKG